MRPLIHLNWKDTPLRPIVEASTSYDDAMLWFGPAWFGGEPVDVYQITKYDIIEMIDDNVEITLHEFRDMVWYRVKIIEAEKVCSWAL